MGNNQLLPFERNRYYVGKLLTSADFQAEQTYGNHKRRFLNEMMFGSGIVCGLGVFSLDDVTVMVDSGVAVDGCGNEITVAAPIIRKLSAVEGFEEIGSNRVTLCLSYREENVHPVYTVRGQENGDHYECNRVREGWDLYLRDSEELPAIMEPDCEFLAEAVLYADDDYQVVCAMPARTPCGAVVRMAVKVTRLKEEAQPLTLKTVIQTPAFTTESGDHELKLELHELCPDGEMVLYRCLTAQTLPAPEAVLLADGQSIQVQVGAETRVTRENFALRATVVDATVDQIVDQAAASANLELRNAYGGQDYVPLAEITLHRTRNAYLIGEVKTIGVCRYIRTAASAPVREELKGWFVHTTPEKTGVDSMMGEARSAQRYIEPIYATGVCDIAFGANLRRGQIAYSDEIIHGLGAGTVHVSVGEEYLAEDAKLSAMARNTIYGNVSLFSHEQAPVVAVETAVKVMNDRGSFVIAARLLEDSTQVVLPLRWVAVALPGGVEETKVQKMAGKSISAIRSTVVMATRESRFFHVRFNNMEPCTLTYELTEKDSGEITSDGIYTAPSREGVFEIRISCAEMPLITTYAYAVVKKRDTQEDEETVNQ